MKQECTELFLRYREVARLVWNLGFWSNPKLRQWDSVDVYREGMARLFEGMILLALGYQGRIENKESPGEVADFRVIGKKREVKLWVDKNRPEEPGHVWGDPVISLDFDVESYELNFVSFFDWDLLSARDFRLLEVRIERLNAQPDLVGRHALVELEGCSIWLIADDDHQKETVSKPAP